MSREEFASHFSRALVQAARDYGSPDPTPEAVVELHLRGEHDCSIDGAVETLFLSEDKFYKCIDVSVHPRRSPDVYFVRASGHEPCPWSETMHAESFGPFHVIIPA